MIHLAQALHKIIGPEFPSPPNALSKLLLRMPPQAMPRIETLSVGSQKPLHPAHKRRRFNCEMKMITHQTISMNLPTRTLTRLPERPQKSPPVLIIKKKSLLAVPSAHHMVNCPSEFDSQLSGNSRSFSDFLKCVNTRD
jgi:hypothetical protein